MSELKLKLELRSLIIGFFSCLMALVFISSTKLPIDQNGRYQATSSERGFLLLDTATGDYILDSEVGYVGSMRWIKGNFATSYSTGKDKTKK